MSRTVLMSKNLVCSFGGCQVVGSTYVSDYDSGERYERSQGGAVFPSGHIAVTLRVDHTSFEDCRIRYIGSKVSCLYLLL